MKTRADERMILHQSGSKTVEKCQKVEEAGHAPSSLGEL